MKLKVFFLCIVTLLFLFNSYSHMQHHHEDIDFNEEVNINPHGDFFKHREHELMLNLLRSPFDATHIAMRSGDWSDPSIWNTNTVPNDNSRVFILENRVVNYDLSSNTRLQIVRIDGELNFLVDRNTKMIVDTLISSPTGNLVIGTKQNPLPSEFRAEIIFADNGPIDTTWDPLHLSRGAVLHGNVTIYGAHTTTFLPVINNPARGETTIIVNQTPQNWKPGDMIVITGTNWEGYRWHNPTRRVEYFGTFDEKRTINSINGNQIEVEALDYDHIAPNIEGVDGLHAYVAHYTRNVVFKTENSDFVPIQQRAHTMFMHSDKVDVHYVEFHELGRTNKLQRATDPVISEEGEFLSGNENVRGRYSVHVHRAGIDDLSRPPALIRGSTVIGSPGWGFVNHESNVIIEDSASWNVNGTHFMTENGNEFGAFRRNIAIKSKGRNGLAKNGRVSHFDLGDTGVGFWMQGRMVEVTDNIVSGTRLGYIFFTRGSPVDSLIPNHIKREYLEFPEIAGLRDRMGLSDPPIKKFDGNTAKATYIAFKSVKSNPNQGHQQRNIISNFLSWESRTGFHIEYVAKYNFENVTIVGISDPQPFVNRGTGGRLSSTPLRDTVLRNVTIINTGSGIHTTGRNGAIFVDVNFINVGGNEWFNTTSRSSFNMSTSTTSDHFKLSSDELQIGVLDFELSSDQRIRINQSGDWRHWSRSTSIDGVQIDSAGRVEKSISFRNIRDLFSGSDGFASHHYTSADGEYFTVVPVVLFDRITNYKLKINYKIFAQGMPRESENRGNASIYFSQLCGNGVCEEGETHLNCPMDCSLNQIPKNRSSESSAEEPAIDSTEQDEIIGQIEEDLTEPINGDNSTSTEQDEIIEQIEEDNSTSIDNTRQDSSQYDSSTSQSPSTGGAGGGGGGGSSATVSNQISQAEVNIEERKELDREVQQKVESYINTRCIPNYHKSSWSSCENEIKFRIVEDSNNCVNSIRQTRTCRTANPINEFIQSARQANIKEVGHRFFEVDLEFDFEVTEDVLRIPFLLDGNNSVIIRELSTDIYLLAELIDSSHGEYIYRVEEVSMSNLLQLSEQGLISQELMEAYIINLDEEDRFSIFGYTLNLTINSSNIRNLLVGVLLLLSLVFIIFIRKIYRAHNSKNFFELGFEFTNNSKRR